MAPRDATLEHLQLAASAAIEKLGSDLVAIDLSEQMLLSEVFLLVSGQNERQIDAIADEVERQLALVGEKPARREGSEHWILLDYEDLVVHIQTEEIRRYYMLDRLWNDCPTIALAAVKAEEEFKRRKILMPNQRIVLWRHGQTDWNIENRFQGHSDIPLNEVGLLQAERAAPLLMALQPSRIISSDLMRAQQTAAALSRISKLNVEIDAGLRETHGGNWEGKTGEQNRAEDFDRFVNWLDGTDEPAGQTGERRSAIAERAVNAINRALNSEVSTLIVVTHGGTARCILGKMLDMPMTQWSAIGGLSNATWSILENGHHRKGWVLVEHNAGSLPEPIYGEESGA